MLPTRARPRQSTTQFEYARPWTLAQGRRGPWGLVGSTNSQKLPGYRWFAVQSSGHPLR
ncbi:hypothetical protein OPAG_07682 [Rhodococcus opacus PD630]|nr:hypothetical protein OPAG_07682 [Rhodococcus opacus PD630]